LRLLDVSLFLPSLLAMSWFSLGSSTRRRLVLDAFVLACFGELLIVVACLWNTGRGFVYMAAAFALACQAQALSGP
jgi:hypothetical protein